MNRTIYILIILLSFSCNQIEDNKSLFKLEDYRNEFKFEKFNSINLDSLDIDFNELTMLDSADYANIFQEKLHYSSIDVNPYYFYSIQEETDKYSSVSIIHYKEALFTEIVLLNHNTQGIKVANKTLSDFGGDGGWEFYSSSKYENGNQINIISKESMFDRQSDSTEVHSIKTITELIEIQDDGIIKTVLLDSIQAIEKRKINYR